MNDYYLFTTIDFNLLSLSYIFNLNFHLFTNEILNIHCINFTEQQKQIALEMYTDVSNAKIIFDCVDDMDEVYNSETPRLYKNCISAVSSKLLIFNRHYKPYMCHFDVDMLFLKDFTGFFNNYKEELIGFRYNKYRTECNTGFVILHTEQNIDIEEYKHYKFKNAGNYEEKYLNSCFTNCKTFDGMHSVATAEESVKNCIFIHYLGGMKPWRFDYTMKPCTRLFIKSFKYWYDFYDKNKSPLTFQLDNGVKEARDLIRACSIFC